MALFLPCSHDDSVRLWNVATHEQVALVDVKNQGLCIVEFLPDGNLFARGFSDKTMQVWCMWSFVQTKLQCIAFPLLQHGRLPPFTLMHIVDHVLGLHHGMAECFGTKKVDWVIRLQRKLNV